MIKKDIIKRIKEAHWDLRVRRPGFLQSKYILSTAITQPVQITPSITLHETRNVWIENIDLCQGIIDEFISKTFAASFIENAKWPLVIMKKMRDFSNEEDSFIQHSAKINWVNASVKEKTKYIAKYTELLLKIQKYYAVAVPLTDWCEQQLKKFNKSLLDYAVQYEMLDIDKMSKSLAHIKNSSEAKKDKLIEQHLRRFAWIKSNYNIIEPYTKEEVLKELQSDICTFAPKAVPKSPFSYLAVALQVGIFLRNRMKEMSQQIWLSHEPFIKQVAKDLSISREDALQLLPNELTKSLKTGGVVVLASELKNRHKGFVVGILDGEEILMTGLVVKELKHHFDSPDIADIKEIKGNIASKGFAVGIAKVLKNASEIGKLNDGEILVTSMTTPDFVIAMKRAGAIVTDEGGLSCHAAIVSRELKIPCVIATKIASKAIKDGDLVEVDANQGIVRILKKKK